MAHTTPKRFALLMEDSAGGWPGNSPVSGEVVAHFKIVRWWKSKHVKTIYLAILCDLLGMVKWPFQRLSDLQLGDKKVTLNHLVPLSLRNRCIEENSTIGLLTIDRKFPWVCVDASDWWCKKGWIQPKLTLWPHTYIFFRGGGGGQMLVQKFWNLVSWEPPNKAGY